MEPVQNIVDIVNNYGRHLLHRVETCPRLSYFFWNKLESLLRLKAVTFVGVSFSSDNGVLCEEDVVSSSGRVRVCWAYRDNHQ